MMKAENVSVRIGRKQILRDVDFLAEAQVQERITALIQALEALKRECSQGQLLNEGAAVALIGAPNAGKSSLLNVLAGEEAAGDAVNGIAGRIRRGSGRHVANVRLVGSGPPKRPI